MMSRIQFKACLLIIKLLNSIHKYYTINSLNSIFVLGIMKELFKSNLVYLTLYD